MAHQGPLDMNERAYRTVRQVTDKHDDTIVEESIDADSERVEAGRKGAAIRNENLTPEQRSEIAKHAAEARWKKSDADTEETDRR